MDIIDFLVGETPKGSDRGVMYLNYRLGLFNKNIFKDLKKDH